jgi:uncharacterized protein YxjI
MKPRLIVEQKLALLANQYRVYGAGEEGAKASLLGFAQQKRLALKEKVMFYEDEAKSRETFTFRAEKVIDLHGCYIVEDEKGETIGMFRKVFGASLVTSTWLVMDKEGNERFEVSEKNVFLAVVRRVGEMIPVVGDLVKLFRYHYKVVYLSTRKQVVINKNTTLIRDHYLLSVEGKSFEQLDWRVWAAQCVALDALQSR